MRIILILSVLVLVLCAGCPAKTSKPDGGNKAKLDMTLDHGSHIEPLVPKVTDPLSETESPAPETTGTTSTGITSEENGEFAVEAVPLPPLEDLTVQIDDYISKIARDLDDLDGSPKYAEDSVSIVRDATAIKLIAFALGLADGDSKYKKSASQIISAAQTLAAAKNLDEGKKGYETLKASLTSTGLTGTGDGKSPAWADKIADIAPAMKALPNLSAAVKRVTDTERKLNMTLDRNPHLVHGRLAALAVISQGCIPNVAETTKPDAEAEWKKYCEEFRDAALKTNAAAHQYAKDKADDGEPNYAPFAAGFKAMTESCDSCHKIFYPSAVGKSE
jgi:hypothetical protein